MSIFPLPRKLAGEEKKVVIYTDCSKQKAEILKDNHKKSGIYRWTHKSSGKTYVGSALDLTHRFRSYFSSQIEPFYLPRKLAGGGIEKKSGHRITG